MTNIADVGQQSEIFSGNLKEFLEDIVNKVDLVKKLVSLNIPSDSYSIGDVENEALCLLNKDGIWSIFYSEKAQRTDEKFYTNENEACQAFFKRLTHMFGC